MGGMGNQKHEILHIPSKTSFPVSIYESENDLKYQGVENVLPRKDVF